MKIAILGAMDEEIYLLKQQISNLSCQIIFNYCIYTGKFNNCDIIMLKTSVGKVNASIGTTLIQQKFNPNYLINTGVAGAMHNDLKVGDIVIANQLSYHDVDVTIFDYKFGQIPSMPEFYTPNSQITKNINTEAYSFNIIHGLITSGDSFISNNEQKIFIKNKFTDVCAADMESCAIAQTCYQLHLPFAIIRSISDQANNTALESYESFMKIAANNSAQLTLDIIKTLL